jgi:thymidylate kinase
MIARKASRNYLGKKNGTRDQHEKDRDFQEATVRTYLQLVRTKPDWKKIDCCERGGKLLSPEAIHEMVMVVVKECVL